MSRARESTGARAGRGTRGRALPVAAGSALARERAAPAEAPPPLARGEARVPAAERTRTFRPNYVGFAGTYQCNLRCAHCCVPIEWTDRLPIDVAVRFLEEAHAAGVHTLGFTGGEPFLYPEFLFALSRRGADLGMRFDKVMSNGCWHEDVAHLRGTLERLYAAGFSGRLGLSVDRFHGARTEKVAEFCRAAAEVSKRDDAVTIAYASPAKDRGLERVRALAKALDAAVEWSDMIGAYMLVSADLSATLVWNHLAPVERAERLGHGFEGEWFEEDYCEGPGQALIVTPRGEVKPCCGFASDLDQLTIGRIPRDSAQRVIAAGNDHPYVGRVFREGLLAIRNEVLARDPGALPGPTSNHCFFCWFVLTRGLATGVPGGGGQVGAWTGERPRAPPSAPDGPAGA